MTHKTKIIATIGPACDKKDVLKKLVRAGMSVARLNLSHGSYRDHKNVIKRIRSLSVEMDRPIGILLDLQGPKIRTGSLKNRTPVELKRNKIVRITTRIATSGTSDLISTTYKGLARDVKKGDTILLDDGLIELRVVSSTIHTVSCRIITGGVLLEHKGINLPGIKISAPSLTEKDKRDLDFGIESGVDYIALSFVRDPADIRRIKSVLRKKGADIPVIAKIEKYEAIETLDSILEMADGIMIARGDLGVELRPEQIPTIQKNIIDKAVVENKPVITATQMLETMTAKPVPTRAEASDVANSIFDGTDAVMLSAETAIGNYPVKAVQMMSKIAREAETSPFMKYNIRHNEYPSDMMTHAVARSSVNILHEINADAIVVFSVSGKTAKLISKQRPGRPVYSFSPSIDVFNRLSLVWGVTPLLIPEIDDAKQIINEGITILKRKEWINNHSIVIIVTGLALKSGSTNVIKIHRVGRQD